MALEMTDYTEQLVINRFFRAQAFTPPAQVFLALFTTATADDGTGTEATGGSYARKSIALTAASGGETENSAVISFSNMPAGTFTHAAVFDATTGGNMLWHGALTTPKTATAGQALEVAVGELVLGFTAGSSATTWLRNLILDHMLRNQAYSPGTVYQALYTTSTGVDGSGTEVSGGTYTRTLFTLSAPIGGVTSNPASVDLSGLPSTTVTHGAVLDASTAGNMMLQRALNASVETELGDTVRFEPGDLTYTVQ